MQIQETGLDTQEPSPSRYQIQAIYNLFEKNRERYNHTEDLRTKEANPLRIETSLDTQVDSQEIPFSPTSST